MVDFDVVDVLTRGKCRRSYKRKIDIRGSCHYQMASQNLVFKSKYDTMLLMFILCEILTKEFTILLNDYDYLRSQCNKEWQTLALLEYNN